MKPLLAALAVLAVTVTVDERVVIYLSSSTRALGSTVQLSGNEARELYRAMDEKFRPRTFDEIADEAVERTNKELAPQIRKILRGNRP